MADDLLAIGDRVVADARPGERVEVYVVRSRDTNVRVYDGEVEQLASAQSQGVGIRVVREGRQGFAYAGSLDEDVVRETLAEARDNTAFGEPDADVGPADPDGVAPPELDLWSDDLAGTPTVDKIELARELERLAVAADPRVSTESSDYADTMVEGAVVTSTGIRIAGRESGCYLVVSTLASQGDETQTGFGFSVARRLADLDVAQAAADGAERATRLLGAMKPPTSRLTVVLDPWVTAQLLSVLSATMTGEAVLKGRSLFAGREGEAVAAELVTLIDDPTNPLAFTATAFDGEGLATRRNVLIRDGVLQGFVHDSWSGRRSGTGSTGSAVRAGFKSTPTSGCMALSLQPGTATQAELLAKVGDGVLVQGVSGLHSGVNPVSGDFSTGAEGLRIRGGELGEPLREFTIGSTLQRILHDVVAVGGDVQWLPMDAAGVSLVVADVTISGI